MPTQRVTFQGHSGDQLAARLDMPDGPHLATAIFAHCFTCSKDIPAAKRVSSRLASMGIAVLRFDFTGLGHSEGEFENTTFTTNVTDLLAAAQYLDSRNMAPSLMIGHSLGGAAVIKAASQLHGIKAVATLAAPADPAHVSHIFADHIDTIETEGVADLTLGGRPFRINKAFLDDIAAEKLEKALGGLNAALLVLHAPTDAIVGIENASAIFMAAKHPKSYVTLDSADHLISNPEDAEYAAEVIAAWSARYLDLRPPAPPIGAPEGVILVTEADKNGYLQDINAGAFHHTQADEPLAYGGTNKGMSPYGFLAAGLGACTSMTIRMYARRKGWPLDNVRVEVRHNKVHAQDAENRAGANVDEFQRLIHLDGPLDPEQRARLVEIADKCPVHKTLERRSEVKTVLAD
ncbi:alpha/beta fold hydrolase [Algirhabdus cladophorae]|uniref:bifunctional alpha/beta hydrolase/OsmC family protein n=1 Tax=Algirhabdus cladophorae TaxID=3377108 RepID=UPI003B845DEB